jgi:hypothetical protein
MLFQALLSIRNAARKAKYLAFSLLILQVVIIPAQALTINVQGVNEDGTVAAQTNYRWLLEEDTTYNIVPGEACQGGDISECLSVNFHKSYMPVVAEGSATDPVPALDSDKRYHLSVLPDSGYSIGGAPIAAGQASVDVTVNALPFPTAQIRIFVFSDNFPISGTPDTPEELGLAGFRILLEDAGGRYGISGQQITTDAFGNPLGTTYDNAGNLLSLGDGSIVTDINGVAVIKNLAPAKYGIQAVPPAGSGYIQTSTIEGTKLIDAWVKANEPSYFAEFGPPGPHVFIGFVKQFADTNVLTGGATITGQVRSIHNSRPPDFAFHTGAPVGGCWVGLNDLAVGIGKGVFAVPCDENSNFTIPDVPEGNYQLAIWDQNLDYIFGSYGVTVGPGGSTCNGGSCNLLDVPVFAWFGRLEQYVFNDTDENGFWDAGEVAMPEQGTNIRWRDGTVYQSFPTDLGGAAPYDTVFPFFSWLVAEVDYARFKATGATIVVDDGGPIDPANDYSSDGVLKPQPQPENAGLDFRTETGPVLTQAFQNFLGQTNTIMWGKKPYVTGENGGISGMVFYAITRAENDPSYAAAEPWEPGIPRIQVALYADNLPAGGDGVIDDQNGNSTVDIADVDNYPFGWSDGSAKGAEDYDYNSNGNYDVGDAIDVTYTDSWDDSLPTGCVGEVFAVDGTPTDCFDGIRNFNQVRPGVFDGGYAFDGLANGNYIVASGEHAGYTTLREEDRNVDFGDSYNPAPELLPPACVGELHTVASDFTLFPLLEDDGVTPVTPFMAGLETPLCDRKAILLSDGKNAAADFFMFTQVPISGHIAGMILDDLSNEFDTNSPTFGEKYSPQYVPVSVRDWKGNVISRTYSDRWGRFNVLVPSTYTTNLPTASGMSPNMLTTCMNDPGPINVGGIMQTDPNYKRQYSQFCYTFQYMPGVTTYLDTPVVPVAAFAGPNQSPLDCQVPDASPVIWSVQGPTFVGPYVETAGQEITITSAVDPAGLRDYGFGVDPGTVTINGAVVPVSVWGDGSITLSVPASGQLNITRADGQKTISGITVTVGGGAIAVGPGQSIQAAIDLAAPGDLILVPPGSYEELVIMWKPVRLQGSGASTVISAIKAPAEKLESWRTSVSSLISANQVDLLPAQEVGNGLFEPNTLFTEEGPGIIVLAKKNGPRSFGFNASRIDGFGLTGADHAGGIIVNGFAKNLEISNNRVFSNHGIYGGGIRLGHPTLGDDGVNENINIHNNYIAENGGGGAAGGGVSLFQGSDNYRVVQNYICGNFSVGDGGGIGHFGRSDDGLIADNKIIFNQTFNQGTTVSGGGIYVGGAPVLNGVTDGSGSVDITGNLIQGNQAGAGDGGGIRTALVNGRDASKKSPDSWHHIGIVNNIIVNNMAGLAGGGISLQDTANIDITNNTIAHNDSTATAGQAFAPDSPNVSTAQPAGIVSYAHSTELVDTFHNKAPAELKVFSNPALSNNIIWRNRSFFFQIDDTQDPAAYGLNDGTPQYWDLAVQGAVGQLNPLFSLLTDITGTDASNINGSGIDPLALFVLPYVNTANGETVQQQELTTSIAAQPAFDEGGNFIEVRFGPLAPTGDYHLATGAAAVDAADATVAPGVDIDGDGRPNGAGVDIGADEAQ